MSPHGLPKRVNRSVRNEGARANAGDVCDVRSVRDGGPSAAGAAHGHGRRA